MNENKQIWIYIFSSIACLSIKLHPTGAPRDWSRLDSTQNHTGVSAHFVFEKNCETFSKYIDAP